MRRCDASSIQPISCSEQPVTKCRRLVFFRCFFSQIFLDVLMTDSGLAFLSLLFVFIYLRIMVGSWFLA